MLLRDDQTNWVMVLGYFRQKMLISLRTYEENASAEKVIHHIVARKGTGGGHPSYAGGQIPIKDNLQKTKDRLEKTVLNRFFKQVVKSPEPMVPLIQK